MEKPEDSQNRKGGETQLLESANDAAKHRQQRGDPEQKERGAMGLGSHFDIGGVADFGPVDTERNAQPDTRDIQARVP